jgi:hypothetical protein
MDEAQSGFCQNLDEEFALDVINDCSELSMTI